MAGRIAKRLAEMNIVLPKPAAPAANYVPAVISGNHVYVSGQGSYWDGKLHYNGKLGHNVSVEDGQKCARLVGLNVLAQLNAALDGDLDRVVRCVKINGYVNSAPDFGDQPKVVNGCSDLMVEVFGEAGRHARSATGAPALPMGISVEIEAIFEIAPKAAGKSAAKVAPKKSAAKPVAKKAPAKKAKKRH